MKDDMPKETLEYKKRLQQFLLDKVLSGLSGRDRADIARRPLNNLFAGVLRPVFAAQSSQVSLEMKQQTSSIGVDFRVRRIDETKPIAITVKAGWSLYYPVFPDWDATLRENTVLREDGEFGRHTEIVLPVVFRRMEVVCSPITIDCAIGNRVKQEHSLQNDVTAAKRKIHEDIDIWHHIGEPKKQTRSLGLATDLGDEAAFVRRLKSVKDAGTKVGLPDWQMSLYTEFGEDVEVCGLTRIVVLLANETPAFDDTDPDPVLSERTVFDAHLEIETRNVELVPFRFVLAEDNYRTNPQMIARGINCVVEGSLEKSVLRTNTLPIYDQPLYRTRDDRGIGFKSLDTEVPEAALNSVLQALSTYGHDWDRYLEKEAQKELTAKEQAQCKEDRGNLAREAEALALGIKCLKQHKNLRQAFRLMNRAFARIGEKSGGKIAAWRLFQICFIVSQLPSLMIRDMDNSFDSEFTAAVKRSFEQASILWFPTGGGKTEAYFGLIATALLFDRLRGKPRGVNTWMRFPLRMLSLQQMERLSKVIAELNELRDEVPEIAVGDPYSIGFFVGQTVTPNSMSEQDMDFFERAEEHRRKLLLLRKCPHCGAEVGIELDREQWRVLHRCSSKECFSNTSQSLGYLKGSLPIFIVDREIYRYLPSVLVGTVDKLAIAGFNTGFSHLINGCVQKCAVHGYASYDQCMETFAAKCPNKKKTSLETLPTLKDPGLSFLLQDELHLLKSDLGVFNGHYEGFLQYIGAKRFLPPKVLAATATIESYDQHAFHLYLKDANRFPVPGWRLGESFYATSLPAEVRRKYVGILCHSSAIDDAAARIICIYQRELKMLRSDLASARALMKAESLSDEQVHYLLGLYDFSVAYVNRKATGSTLLYKIDTSNTDLVYSGLPKVTGDLLTADRTQDEIGATLERIENELNYRGSDRLDVIAATSLISHGVDIERINMMTMCGMPSHYAEYVQSSSRSARSHPGIVFSCFQSRDVRELSQFEMFYPMHENMDSLIESVAVNRFASFAPVKTIPGLLSALLINGLGPELFKKDIAKPLNHVPTLRVALGLSSKGSSGTKKCINTDSLREALENIVGVDREWPLASAEEVANVRVKIGEILTDLIALIGRTPELKLPDVLHPITSFRDVDEGLEFGSLESSSLVNRLRGN